MKALIQAVVVSCALAAPALSFAQAQQGEVTRAQVREDLQRVEAAGYRPISRDATYPDDIQAAEAKVAAGGRWNIRPWAASRRAARCRWVRPGRRRTGIRSRCSLEIEVKAAGAWPAACRNGQRIA